MGDHRAACRIEFEFHDKTYKLNLAWVNWVDSYSGVDHRVLEFFDEAYQDGRRRYFEGVDREEEKQRAAETEKTERETLARLKAKYEAEGLAAGGEQGISRFAK